MDTMREKYRTQPYPCICKEAIFGFEPITNKSPRHNFIPRTHRSLAVKVMTEIINSCLVLSSEESTQQSTFVCMGQWEPTWSTRAAEEAEVVAAIPCSGHGRAYLDGLILKDMNKSLCECNSCYAGSDCSQFLSDCPANADGGDPYFMEPFWIAILVSGWHRMGYSYSDGSYISQLLVEYIKKLDAIVGNAISEGKYIVFGSGSTLFSMLLFMPCLPTLQCFQQNSIETKLTQIFNSRDFSYEGDTSLWKNNTNSSFRFIEFVTSPNNPDGKLNKGVLKGSDVKTIYDRAYYWPHFTAISSPADDDLMVWTIIKDEAVYQKMMIYLRLSTIGISRDVQLRVLKLLDVATEGDGKEIFQFTYSTMRDRWIRLKQIIYKSKQFSLQKLFPNTVPFSRGSEILHQVNVNF
ncbi:Tryptophan aminotransferase-related protein 4 [Glycine soja]